jgi:hypothetical protein
VPKSALERAEQIKRYARVASLIHMEVGLRNAKMIRGCDSTSLQNKRASIYAHLWAVVRVSGGVTPLWN